MGGDARMAGAGAAEEPGRPGASGTAAEMGEIALIDTLVAGRTQPPAVLLGPGDDAALVAAPDGRVVVSTDALVAGRHFRLDWSSPHDVGRKAVAQNVADIEAMGARATALVVASTIPPATPVAVLTALTDGMWSEASHVGAGIVGGDVVAGPVLSVSVTVLGDLGGRAPVTRAGARPGDVLAVCGELGWSAAGWRVLALGLSGHDALRRRHRVPEPPYGQGAAAAEAGASAMTDVSDGLLADVGSIARASGVTVDVHTAALIADRDALAAAAGDAGADPLRWVLTGGEDHALAATFAGSVPPGWRVVGAVTAGPGLVTVDGRSWDGPAGWQSFD